jgi:hypothetical protein
MEIEGVNAKPGSHEGLVTSVVLPRHVDIGYSKPTSGNMIVAQKDPLTQ